MRWLHILQLVSVLFFTHQPSQIAKNIGSMSIRYRSDAKVSDRCLIDVDPTVFAIWAVGRYIIAELIWACDSFKDLYDSHFQIIMLLTFTFLLGIHLFFTSFCILANYQLFKRRYILIGCIRQFDWWTFETSLITTNGERDSRKVDIYIFPPCHEWHENYFPITGPLWPVTGGFPHKRSVIRGFVVLLMCVWKCCWAHVLPMIWDAMWRQS